MDLRHVVVLALSVVACACDLRTRRIPNALTFGGAALALAYSTWVGGVSGCVTSAGGWLVGVASFFRCSRSAVWVRRRQTRCVHRRLARPDAGRLRRAVLGDCRGRAGLIVALATGYFKQAVGNVWLLLAHWRVVGVRPLPELTLETSRGPRLPFACRLPQARSRQCG
jgi:prepilin peptidase CpaA